MGYASGKVLSLPLPGKVTQSRLTDALPEAAYCSAGNETLACPCRSSAPGAAPQLQSHPLTFSLAVTVCRGLIRQPPTRTTQQLTHPSPSPPQWDQEKNGQRVKFMG